MGNTITKTASRRTPAKPAGYLASPRSELAASLVACRSAFLGVALISGLSNILMLTGAFFMLQIYDRVLPSGSVPTLVALSLLVAGLFTALGVFNVIRSRILVRIGAALDEDVSARVYDAIGRLPLKTKSQSDGLQPLRDLDTIRSFLSGMGPTALFDLPWMPVYLAIIFAFHTVLGLTALIGAIVLIVLTILTEVLTRAPAAAAADHAQLRNGLAEASRSNAEVLAAMGMAQSMGSRWSEANQSYMESQRRISDVGGGLGAISRALRMLLQSAVLGVGAYFVINQEATAGIIIAGAILVGRALAPVDLAIANWKGFVSARQSWQRLNKLLKMLPAHLTPMELPAPSSSFSAEAVTAVPPGEHTPAVQNISFYLKAGDGLGIIGPSASGKSSLARALVGVWQPVRGKVCLDGAALDQWSPDVLGPHIGYVPQDVELFTGSVAENISRFEPDAEPAAIIAAAKAAGVHELIVDLPEGFETQIGDKGNALSAGQRQRVALARALYGQPFLVVLDEPNSNLDSEGEAALTQAIYSVRERGGIVVVVSHRPITLSSVDLVLTMAQGKTVAFGPKDEVLSKVLRSVSTAPAGNKITKAHQGETQ